MTITGLTAASKKAAVCPTAADSIWGCDEILDTTLDGMTAWSLGLTNQNRNQSSKQSFALTESHSNGKGSLANEGCLVFARLHAMPMNTGFLRVTAVLMAW